MRPYLYFLLGLFLIVFAWLPRSLSVNKEEKMAEEIGILKVPAIRLEMSIFESCSEKNMEKGAGVVEWSDYPGTGKHCILAGHSGLPGKQIFDRIDELKKGDFIYLYVDGKEEIYEVFQIEVRKPEDTDFSFGEGNGDEKEKNRYLSLVTCTPYGINNKRLVVTGVRKGKTE